MLAQPPWYVRNTTLLHDLRVDSIRKVNKKQAEKFHQNIHASSELMYGITDYVPSEHPSRPRAISLQHTLQNVTFIEALWYPLYCRAMVPPSFCYSIYLFFLLVFLPSLFQLLFFPFFFFVEAIELSLGCLYPLIQQNFHFLVLSLHLPSPSLLWPRLLDCY